MQTSRNFTNLLNDIEFWGQRLVGVVVHLNDTYLIDERPEEELPGFPRVIATIKRLRAHTQRILGEDRVLVLHSGDFLSPSRLLLKKDPKGRQTMIKLLDRMGLNYCVLGNHEFDHKEEDLAARLKEASFKVVLSNVKPPDAIEAVERVLWPPTKPVIELTGIVSDAVYQAFPKTGWSSNKYQAFPKIGRSDPTALSDLVSKTQKVPFHLVLTHADRSDDREMMKMLNDCPRTYMLGGHDHDIDWIEADDPTPLMKNSANLRTVRVLLLLAGGDMAMQELYKNYTSFKGKHGTEPIYPKDSDELLEGLCECDAEVFRAWLDRKDPLYHLKYNQPNRWLGSYSQSYFTDDEDLPADALVSRLDGMPFHYDMLSWLLRYDDHESADDADTKIVNDAMTLIQEGSDDDVVCDFSEVTEKKLDASEKSIRSMPTDFGVFVAECVRRRGNADVAIVNSGSFRCDSLLPTKLRMRHLRDTFTYDNDDTIIVLEIDGTLVDALLAHGKGEQNKGTFSQVADARQDPSSSKIAVAIASFLLLGNSNDSKGPYLNLVAEHLKKTTEQARSWVLTERGKRRSFGIIDAIKEYGGCVGYRRIDPVSIMGDTATTFIDLAKKTLLLFEKKYPYSIECHREWNESLRSLLSGDHCIADNDLQNARDEIRKFLRQLPDVQRYDNLASLEDLQNSDMSPRIREQAMQQLRALREEIMEHRLTFKDQTHYYRIFDAGAHGIAGYQRS